MIADLKTRRMLDDAKSGETDSDEAPDFAVELFREFPQAPKTLKVATAVRMSATFPFISPAVRLPLQKPLPRRRCRLFRQFWHYRGGGISA